MGWIKAYLPTDWHAKLKAYRDANDMDNLPSAATAAIQRGLLSYESENGELEHE